MRLLKIRVVGVSPKFVDLDIAFMKDGEWVASDATISIPAGSYPIPIGAEAILHPDDFDRD